jgi:hypothetical protein
MSSFDNNFWTIQAFLAVGLNPPSHLLEPSTTPLSAYLPFEQYASDDYVEVFNRVHSELTKTPTVIYQPETTVQNIHFPPPLPFTPMDGALPVKVKESTPVDSTSILTEATVYDCYDLAPPLQFYTSVDELPTPPCHEVYDGCYLISFHSHS